MLVPKEITNIYLWEYIEPTPSTIVLFDDDFTTMSNSQLIAQWFLSVGDSYGLTTSSNWLHRVTFETDTASWIELPVSYNLQWKTLYWECEWYSWTFKRWWNIWLSLDRPANYSNKRKKYDVTSEVAWWGVGLTSLPGFWQFDGYVDWYHNISSWTFWYRDGNSSNDINLCWDQPCTLFWWTTWDAHLSLPFTTWTYKFKWNYNFSTWKYTSTWITPDWTEKTFTRDISWSSSSNLNSVNEWLSWSNKYIRLTNSRWYWTSSYDICYWRKAKIRIE